MKKVILFACVAMALMCCQLTYANQSSVNTWLMSQQRLSGAISSESDVATSTQATQEAALALLNAEQAASDVVESSLIFLSQAELAHISTEQLSRLIILKASAGQAVVNELQTLSLRRAETGGYSDYLGEAPSVLSTSFALLARSAAGSAVDSQSLIYLRDRQQGNGGWLFPEMEGSSTSLTAYVLSSVWNVRAQTNVTDIVESAQAFLLSQKNTVTSLWADTETSALALYALLQSSLDRSDLQSSITALVDQQLSNGSFQDDVYISALLSQLLQLNQQAPADVITLRGRVIDADTGFALSGAQIELQGNDSMTLNSDANGEFSVELVGAGSYALSVTAAGFNALNNSLSLNAGDRIDLRDLSLNRTGSDTGSVGVLRGTVVAALDGAPLEGAVIMLNGAVNSRAVTDSQGNYFFADLAVGQTAITVSLTGFQTVLAEAMIVSNGELIFSPSLQQVDADSVDVFGVVTEQTTGLPISMASVEVTNNGVITSAQTDTNGAYQVSNLSEGQLDIRIEADGFNAVTASANTQSGARLNYSPTLVSLGNNPEAGQGLITASLINRRSGQAISGATVIASGITNVTLVTDQRGRFQTPSLDEGAVTIELSATGFISRTLDIDVIGGSELNLGRISLQPEQSGEFGSLTGVVINAVTEQALAGVTVTVNGLQTVLTNAQGGFTFEGLTGEEASLSFSNQGFRSIDLSVFFSASQTVNLANVRLRPEQAEVLLPDLAIININDDLLQTDLNSLAISGALRVNIANAGTQLAVVPSEAVAFIDENNDARYDAQIDTLVGKTVLLDPLDVESSTQLDIPVSGTVSFRDAPIYVTLDANGVVIESDESNNTGLSSQFCTAPDIEQPEMVPGDVPDNLIVADGYQLELFAPNVTTQQGPNQLAFNQQGDLFLALGDRGLAKIPAGTNVPESFGATSPFDSDGVALDSQGNVIASGSPVTKYASDGRVIWEVSCPIDSQLMTVDENDNVYVGSLSSSFCKITPDGLMVETIGGFSGPSEPVADLNGLLYVGQLGPRNIAVVSLETATIVDTLDIGFFATNPVFDNDNKLHIGIGPNSVSTQAAVLNLEDESITVLVSGFTNARARALGPDGNLYIAETSNGNIYKLTLPKPAPVDGSDYTLSQLQLHDTGAGNAPDVTVRIGNASLPRESSPLPTYLRFDGDDYVEIRGIEPVFEHTVEFWYRRDPSSSSRIQNNGPVGLGLLDGPFSCGQGSLFRQLPDGRLSFQVDPAGCGGSGASNIITAPLDDDWNHYAGTYDGTTASLYVNGELIGSQAALYSVSPNLILGTDSHAPFLEFITGDIDDVRVWRTALSQADIQQRFCTELSGDETSLSVYLPLNEGQGDIINDLSPAGVSASLGSPASAPTWASDTQFRAQCGGGTMAEQAPVTVTLYNGNPIEGGTLLATQTLDNPPASFEFLDVTFSALDNLEGVNQLFAVVDANNQIGECNEGNNSMSIALALPSQLGELATTTDQNRYPENATVLINQSVTNTGKLVGNYQVATQVLDMDGRLVTQLPLLSVNDLVSTATLDQTQELLTGNTLAGDYRIVSALTNAQGVLIANNEQVITLVSSLDDNAIYRVRTLTDRIEYHVTDVVQIDNLVGNASANVLGKGVTLSVITTDITGAVVFDETIALNDLVAEASAQSINTLTLTNALQGGYQVTATLLNEQFATLATDTTDFNVVNNLRAAVTGAVSSSNTAVFLGDQLSCSSRIENQGALDITALPVRQIVINMDNNEEPAREQDQAVTLTALNSVDLTDQVIDTEELLVGNYACALQAFIDQQWVNFDTDFFEVLEQPINIELVATAGDTGRVLVLLDNSAHCTDDPHGPRNTPDLATQQAYLENVLSNAGWSYTITLNDTDFVRELRTGGYSNYLLLAEIERLSHFAQKELREAVYRGEGLVEAGKRLQPHEVVNSALGIQHRGQERRAQGIELLDSGLLSSGALEGGSANSLVLTHRDKNNRVTARSAQTVADYMNGQSSESDHHAGRHWHRFRYFRHHSPYWCPPVQRTAPAITLNEYGLGKAVYMGFDLLSEASTLGGNTNAFSELLLNALVTVNPKPPLTTIGTDYPIVFTVSNLANATPVTLVLPIPDNVSIVDAGDGVVNAESQSISWSLDLAQAQQKDIRIWVVMPSVSTTLNASVVTGEAPNDSEQATASVELSPETAMSIDDVIESASQARALKKVKHSLKYARWYQHKGRTEHALRSLLIAAHHVAQLQKHYESANLTALRVNIGLLIRQAAQQVVVQHTHHRCVVRGSWGKYHYPRYPKSCRHNHWNGYHPKKYGHTVGAHQALNHHQAQEPEVK